MQETAVALTDYALTAENAVLAVLLWRATAAQSRSQTLRPEVVRQGGWFTLFFAMISLSSALGGTFHGYIGDQTTLFAHVLWRGVMITVGLVALAAATAAGCMWRESVRRVVAAVAVAGFVAYCVVVLFVSQEFRNAILVYLPATVFLLVSFIAGYLRTRASSMLAGTVGMLLTFVAAGIQQSSAGISVAHLDHNALYHALQAVALVLVFVGARASLRIPAATSRSLAATR
jgi:hypothetical protein